MRFWGVPGPARRRGFGEEEAGGRRGASGRGRGRRAIRARRTGKYQKSVEGGRNAGRQAARGGERRYRGAFWPPPSVQKGWTCLEPEQTGRWAASGAEPGKAGATSALTTFGHTHRRDFGHAWGLSSWRIDSFYLGMTIVFDLVEKVACGYHEPRPTTQLDAHGPGAFPFRPSSPPNSQRINT